MKKIFSILCFLAVTNLIAQTSYTDLLKQMPEAWNKESAVILQMTKSYTAQNDDVYYSPYMKIKETITKKIKINDLAAVEDFSQLFFPTESTKSNNNNFNSGDKVLCTVVKKDGSRLEVKEDQAIPMQVNSSLGNNWSYGNYTYMKKLAVPNLEIGDIIEYSHTYTSYSSNLYIDRIYLQDDYPIVELNVELSVSSDYDFKQVTFNSAKKLSNENSSRYKLQLNNVEKVRDELWSYKPQNIPFIRYKIQRINPNKKVELDDEKYLQEYISKELYENQYAKMNKKYSSKILRFINKNYKNETDPGVISQHAYYYFRYLVSEDAFNGTIVDGNKRNAGQVSDIVFISTMLDVLNTKKIPVKIAAFVPRDAGNLDHALMPFEYTLGLKVGEGKTFYLFNFTNNSLMDELPADYTNTETYAFTASKHFKKAKIRWALSIQPTFIILPLVVYAVENGIHKNKRVYDVQKSQIPKSDPETNLVDTEIKIDLNKISGNSEVNASRKVTLGGNNKGNFSSLFAARKELMEEDKAELGLKTQQQNLKLTPLMQKLNDLLIEKEEKEIKAYLQNDVEDEDLQVSKFNSYKLINHGRSPKNPLLVYEQNFDLADAVFESADKKSIFINAGSLIGGQITLKENQMKRYTNIDFPNARTISNSIEFTVPEGFTAVNLKDFETKIDNETGSFISSASLVGNKIVIKTSKVYKLEKVKKEDWGKMVDFLDAAYHFTQKKLILSKQ